MIRTRVSAVAIGAGMFAAASAFGAVTITQGTSAPTYTSTLTFDEPGGPTGVVPTNSWASIGIASLASGTGDGVVAQINTNPGFGWAGTGNIFAGAFGVFLNFAQDVDAFSVRYWDPSGPATFMGGGAAVIALNDGMEVAFHFIPNPAYGGVGEEYFNITTDGGMVFDEVRMLGFGFFPEAIVDDLSWNTIPSPGATGVLALGAMAMTRRRR